MLLHTIITPYHIIIDRAKMFNLVKKTRPCQTCDHGIKLHVLSNKFRDLIAKSFVQEVENHRDQNRGQPKYEHCKYIPLFKPIIFGSLNKTVKKYSMCNDVSK